MYARMDMAAGPDRERAVDISDATAAQSIDHQSQRALVKQSTLGPDPAADRVSLAAGWRGRGCRGSWGWGLFCGIAGQAAHQKRLVHADLTG